jgi:plasmid maintenance system antidote protein VapI
MECTCSISIEYGETLEIVPGSQAIHSVTAIGLLCACRTATDFIMDVRAENDLWLVRRLDSCNFKLVEPEYGHWRRPPPRPSSPPPLLPPSPTLPWQQEQ